MRLSLAQQKPIDICNKASNRTTGSLPATRAFKTIDLREQIHMMKRPKQLDGSSGSKSPEFLGPLYNTGFRFKHFLSPVCCDKRMSSDLQMHAQPAYVEKTRQTVTAQPKPRTGSEMKDMTFKHDWTGDIGWDVTNPMFMVTERKTLPDHPHKW
jgi:hypothetical protein